MQQNQLLPNWLIYQLFYQYTMMFREDDQLRFETYDLGNNLVDSWNA